jgi:hypothetical protein
VSPGARPGRPPAGTPRARDGVDPGGGPRRTAHARRARPRQPRRGGDPGQDLPEPYRGTSRGTGPGSPKGAARRYESASGRWPPSGARWWKTTRMSPGATSPIDHHIIPLNGILARSPRDPPLPHLGPRSLLAAPFPFLAAPACGLGIYGVCFSALGLSACLMRSRVRRVRGTIC